MSNTQKQLAAALMRAEAAEALNAELEEENERLRVENATLKDKLAGKDPAVSGTHDIKEAEPGKYVIEPKFRTPTEQQAVEHQSAVAMMRKYMEEMARQESDKEFYEKYRTQFREEYLPKTHPPQPKLPPMQTKRHGDMAQVKLDVIRDPVQDFFRIKLEVKGETQPLYYALPIVEWVMNPSTGTANRIAGELLHRAAKEMGVPPPPSHFTRAVAEGILERIRSAM